MFIIIGGDGKEYGPVTADQVRAWLAQGRANLETKAKALGSEEWRRLGDYAEFAPHDGTPPVIGTPGEPVPVATVPILAEVPSANRWLRLGGAFIDGIIKALCWVPTARAVGQSLSEVIIAGRQPSAIEIVRTVSDSVALSLPYLVGLVVIQAVLLTLRGQSIGKLLLGLRIVRKADGSRAGFVNAFLLRGTLPWVIEQVPLFGGLFWIVDACFIFGDERRCVHDYIAGTRVVKV